MFYELAPPVKGTGKKLKNNANNIFRQDATLVKNKYIEDMFCDIAPPIKETG